MLQFIDGVEVYVVEFDTMPKFPITWDNPQEQPYALALEDAIRTEKITEPGKYGFQITPRPFDQYHYNVYAVLQ